MTLGDHVRVLAGANINKRGVYSHGGAGARPFGVSGLSGRDPAHVVWLADGEVLPATPPVGGPLGPMGPVRAEEV